MIASKQPQECNTCIHKGKFETKCCVMSGHYYEVCSVSKIQVVDEKPIIRCSAHSSQPVPEASDICTDCEPPQPQSDEYLLITAEELLIVEHGCIYPDKNECIGKLCKYHDPNPSFRDNIVCLLNQHDVADNVRSRPHTPTAPEQCPAQAVLDFAIKDLEREIKDQQWMIDNYSGHHKAIHENISKALQYSLNLFRGGEQG